MEGYLHKWVNYFYGWRRRYFILHNGVLHYCKDKCRQQKGTVELGVAILIPNPRDQRKFRLDTGCTVLHLWAATVDEAKAWISAIRTMQDWLTKEESEKELREAGSLLSNSSLRFLNIRRELTLVRSSQEQLQILIEAMQKKVSSDEPFAAKTLEFKRKVEEVTELLSAEEQRYIRLQEEISRQTENLKEEHDESLEGSMDFKDAVSDDEEIFERIQIDHQEAEAPETRKKRTCLPIRRNPEQKLNIWKVIKDSIGSELSKIAVPVYFNEPLSFLQRFSEELTYSSLLVKAAQSDDPELRLAYVTCFTISAYSTSLNRTMKPFNPILGETFDLELDSFKLVAEQVTHHPPVTALHCQHPDFKFYGSLQPRTQFKGSHLAVKCGGTLHVELPNWGEHYIWQKPETSVYNIIIGQIYIDHHGTFVVRNTTTGARCEVDFKKRGWFENSTQEAKGEVFDPVGVKRYSLSGKWSGFLDLTDERTQEIVRVWETFPMPPDCQFYYYFTYFALQLNTLPEHDTFPTDSRRRPDQRALENGDIEQASSEKYRLEEKQRAAVRERAERRPKWFSEQDGEWVYHGGYWENKAAGFSEDLDFF